jgi:single-stranded DNA-specific DHH superfamily exonuclease
VNKIIFTNKEKVEEFKSFINNIKPEDKLAVIYDTDMDGISAGVLAVKGLEKIGIKVHFQRSRTPGTRTLTQDILDVFENKKITNIIFLDLPVEGYSNSNSINKYKVMVIDHHPTLKEHNKKFTIIKSFDIQNTNKGHKYCTAHMIYDLFSELTDMNSFDWIATTGIIGDITYTAHKEWVDSILKKYDVEIKENPFDTKIGELVQYATYATCIGTQEEMNSLFNALYLSKDYQTAINNLDHLTPIKEEYEKKMFEFDEKKEVHGHIIFYEFESEYYVNSPVCTTLSILRVPEKCVLSVHIKDGIASVSARDQKGKLHVGNMMKDCTKGLPDSNGGGHPVAAGAKVNIEDYETFKKRVLLWVKEHE